MRYLPCGKTHRGPHELALILVIQPLDKTEPRQTTRKHSPSDGFLRVAFFVEGFSCIPRAQWMMMVGSQAFLKHDNLLSTVIIGIYRLWDYVSYEYSGMSDS